MSEEDYIIDELEAEPIENNNPIEDLLRSIESQSYTDAEEKFNDIIGDRLQDTLDQAKVRIAGKVFNASQELEDEDFVDDYLDDEDLSEYEFEEDDDYLNDIG
jgi:hypothetical protein